MNTKSFGIRTIAILVFAVSVIFSNAALAQVAPKKAIDKRAIPTVPREVRVVTQDAAMGQTITVVLQTDAAGDESIYGFSLNYNTAVLTLVPNSVVIGSGATRQAGGMCDLESNTNTAGQIGYSVDCRNSTITAGNNRPLVTMQFTVAASAPLGSTPLTFGDVPARRAVSSNPAAGPIQRLPTNFTNGAVNIVSASGATRVVRVVSQNSRRGATVTVVLQADAAGDESIYGFSLNYETAVLTLVPNSVMIGSGATSQPSGMCDVLENAGTPGRIGFSIDCGNKTITAGNNRPLVTMQFTIAANAPTGQTPLTFSDTPARRAVSSNPAAGPIMRLATTFADGFINTSPATAANVQISGRVLTARGGAVNGATVFLTDDSGATIRTRTNPFGFYRFEVGAGATYVIGVNHKTYQFEPRTITALQTTENFDFTAQP